MCILKLMGSRPGQGYHKVFIPHLAMILYSPEPRNITFQKKKKNCSSSGTLRNLDFPHQIFSSTVLNFLSPRILYFVKSLIFGARPLSRPTAHKTFGQYILTTIKIVIMIMLMINDLILQNTLLCENVKSRIIKFNIVSSNVGLCGAFCVIISSCQLIYILSKNKLTNKNSG